MAQTHDYISTKDQLGKPDQTGLFIKRVTDNIFIDDRPLIVYQPTTNNTWIVGTSTNAIVGTWTGTLGGGQLVVGVVPVNSDIVRVVNRNNIHVERFLTDNLNDDSETTGDWNTTTQQLTLTSGQIAQNLSYYMNEINIINATMTVEGTNVDNATLYLSSKLDDVDDFPTPFGTWGETVFEEVSNGVQHGFTNIGSVGKWRIVASDGTVVVDKITITYNQ